MTMNSTEVPNQAAPEKITSNLNDGKQRFLSQVVAHSFASGLRSARDFIRHFPPRAIMVALATQPRLRAKILVPTIGLHEKVALKKSAESSGDDLQIGLDEKVIDEDAIVRLFDPDDRVRYLDERKLWAFLVEGDFWKVTASQALQIAVAKTNLAYILDCARANGLITDHDIVEGLTLDRILQSLPKSELAKLLRSALAGGRHGRPFDDEALLGALGPTDLLEHIAPAQMWDSVILSRIAAAHGFIPPSPESKVPPSPLADATDDELVVELTETDAGTSKAATKGGRGRRIAASELSEVKSEIEGTKN
jgi:hypothetical protein